MCHVSFATPTIFHLSNFSLNFLRFINYKEIKFKKIKISLQKQLDFKNIQFVFQLQTQSTSQNIRAFSLGVSNAKYFTFDTPNTTIQASCGVPNVSKICNMVQYRLKYETLQTSMPKIFWLI